METWCHLNSSEKPSGNADVKKLSRNKNWYNKTNNDNYFCTTFYSFQYFYLMLIICVHWYKFEYSDLIISENILISKLELEIFVFLIIIFNIFK